LPWLFGVARNLLAKQRDSRQRRKALLGRITAGAVAQEQLIWDVAEQVVDKDAALTALASMPEKDLEAMALATWHGLDPQESAAVMGCSVRAYHARLHRALRTPHASSSRLSSPRSTLMTHRTRFLITGGTAVAGLAAAAIIVPGAVSGHAAHGKVSVTASGPAAGTAVDAHSFLLTAAETAVQEPARSGRFWYTRTRTTSWIRSIPSVYQAKLEALQKELTAKKTAAHGDAAALRRAQRETEEKVRQIKLHSDPPFSATSSETSGTWRARQAGGTNRNLTRPGAKVTFGSAQDEARWRAMGSPALVDGRR
jgi:hypothetical protein